VLGTEIELAPAEIVGAIVSPINKLDKAAKGVRAAAAIGTRDAFLAGMGYSDSTDLGEMVKGGVEMAPYGLAGGVALGSAAVGVKKAYVKLRPARAPSAPAVDPTPARAAKPKTKPNGVAEGPDAAPVRAAEPEKGALFTPEELVADPEMAVRRAKQRIAKLTPEEAQSWVARISKAEETGELLDDPHYRSILNIDTSGVIEDAARPILAINAAEEVLDTLKAAAQAGKQPTEAIKAKAADGLAGMTDTKLDEMVARSAQSPADNALAALLMVKSGVEAVRSYDRFLSALAEGAGGARETLQAELGRSVYLYASGRAIRSDTGRGLQAGQIGQRLAGEHLETTWALPPRETAERFNEALNQLDLDDLKDHLSKLRSGDDLGRVLDPLMDPEHARSVAMWRRAVGSFESALKSTVLTPITGVVNAVSNVLHDGFRNGLARRLVEAYHTANSNEIAALSMRLEREAANAAYWQAHIHGLRAMLDRVKFDLWEGVESTAGLVSRKARERATASRTALSAANEFDLVPKDFAKGKKPSSMDPAYRLRVNDLGAYEQKVADLQASGAFGSVWARMYQAGAVTLNAAAREGFTDYDQYQNYEQATQAGVAAAAFGMKDVVLSKSYMKSLRDFMSLLTGGEATWQTVAGNAASSLIPFGGTQRLVNDTLVGHPLQAVTVSDNLYRSLIGVGLGLPARLNALGDKMDGRTLGIAAGEEQDSLEEVGRMLQEYRLDVSDVKATDPAGFQLSSQQLNRLRYLRGHAALDVEGRTLREALADAMVSEEFQLFGSREARQALVNRTIRSFNAPARALLEEEDADYAGRRAAKSVYEDWIKDGASVSDATEASMSELADYIDD